jgi:hypothetical protein
MLLDHRSRAGAWLAASGARAIVKSQAATTTISEVTSAP